MSNTLDLIHAIINKDAVASEAAFQAAMAEKISANIETMRTDLSTSMFNTPEEVVEEEFELEEAKKKWKKMCEELAELELSEEELEEAKKKWKKMCEGLTNEDVEQIDELSTQTIASYRAKAHQDDKRLNKVAKAHATLGNTKEMGDAISKQLKRRQGEWKARKRLISRGVKWKDKVDEEVDQIDEKNWIAGAIKHPGAETAAAKRAGMGVQAYAHKHEHDSGKAGKRARLAITLANLRKK